MAAGPAGPWRRGRAPDRVLAALLLLPAVFFCLAVMAYPLGLEVWFSFSSAQAGENGSFIGLANFQFLAGLPTFHQVLLNSAIYLIGSTLIKAILGLGVALALITPFRGRRLVYAALFLPFIFPVVLSTSAWYFLLGNVHGGLDYLLIGLRIIERPLDLKGSGNLPMVSVVLVNVWHGTALFAVLLLAGLRSVGRDVLEAATSDGAGPASRFWNVVRPQLAAPLTLAAILSLLGTFGDFAVVFLLTGGGPLGKTEIVPTFAFANALRAGDLGLGAAIALSLLPVYVLGMPLVLRVLGRR